MPRAKNTDVTKGRRIPGRHAEAAKQLRDSECNTCPWAAGCVSFFRPQDKCREFARHVMEA